MSALIFHWSHSGPHKLVWIMKLGFIKTLQVISEDCNSNYNSEFVGLRQSLIWNVSSFGFDCVSSVLVLNRSFVFDIRIYSWRYIKLAFVQPIRMALMLCVKWMLLKSYFGVTLFTEAKNRGELSIAARLKIPKNIYKNHLKKILL